MSLDIVVSNDSSEDYESDENTIRDSRILAWVMSRVEPWEEWRDTNFEVKWDEYYRLWRGIPKDSDKTRQSERSKLITPALQQAVEMTVAELEEATFGKGRWFDVSEDVADEDEDTITVFRDQLLEDMDGADVPSAMSEIFLNAALYGTGIGKIIVEVVSKKSIIASAVEEGLGVYEAASEEDEVVSIRLQPIHPKEFVIDPSARTIDEALGCAHICVVPRHSILDKQKQGVYRDVALGSYTGDVKILNEEESRDVGLSDKVKVTEWHGLVPASLLDPDLEPDEELVRLDTGKQTHEETDGEYDDVELVEAIVTIANDGVVLRAIENANTMADRSFVAYQHDKCPGRFWGIGVSEKGYWPQKALDAEVRARIDAMGLTVHPMMGVDATRIPRGVSLTVEPGKMIPTNGDPATILRPMNFGQVGNQTFHQSGELERMVQMGTGAMDSATPIGTSPRNQTASGMSMIASSAIKRSKRTLANIERHFTKPFIQKAAWRYMQFDPDRYPTRDVKFQVHSTLGIMARELEQQQLTTLLQTAPPDSPMAWMLIRSIYENSSITDREEMIQLSEQMLQQSMQPTPDPMAEAKMQEVQLKAKEAEASLQIEAQRAKTEADRLQIEAENANTKKSELVLKNRELDIKEAQVGAEIIKKEADSILAVAKAEAEEIGTQLEIYTAQVEQLKGDATQTSKTMQESSKKTSSDVSAIMGKLDEIATEQQNMKEDLSKVKNVEKEVKVIEKEITSGNAFEQKDDSKIDELSKVIKEMSEKLESTIKDIAKPKTKKIERDAQGRVLSVNGKKPKRNSKTGLIEEI